MRKKGLTLWLCIAVILLAWPGDRTRAQGEPPLPPPIDRDCAMSGETCRLHVNYSYSGAFFIEDTTQESAPIPGNRRSTTHFHNVKFFGRVGRGLVREAQLHDGVHPFPNGDEKDHEVYLSYVFEVKRYSEECKSRQEGDEFYDSHILRIATLAGLPVDQFIIAIRRDHGKESVDYLRFRAATAQRGQGMDNVAAFKDRTRCALPAFPFQMVRDPDLKPSPE